MTLTTACARLALANGHPVQVKSRRKAALDYIDAHLGDARLRPDEIAKAANLSRASLYRLLAAEGGIHAVLLRRRLDEALRLMLEDAKGEHALKQIVRCCGFGGTSQLSRAFRARFGAPPRQYCALVRQQGLDWHEARLMADGFDQDAMSWRHRALRGPTHGADRAPRHSEPIEPRMQRSRMTRIGRGNVASPGQAIDLHSTRIHRNAD